jgi:leucyl-tRNA---protein transferase
VREVSDEALIGLALDEPTGQAMTAASEQSFSHYPAWPAPRGIMLPTLPAHPCPYLPGRSAQVRGGLVRSLDSTLYQEFMDAGCRRSGRFIYQPACPGCRACVPVRLDVRTFSPRRTHRRCINRNTDLRMRVDAPSLTDEKLQLYTAYQHWRHSETDTTREQLYTFLYESPTETLEFTYRDSADRLLAVGICDRTPTALSSVYFYYTPEAAGRGIGIFGALREIEFARQSGLDFYYLGFWVDGCERMAYKREFGPDETLGTDGIWRTREFPPTM